MIEFLKDILKVSQSATNIDVALLVLRVAVGVLMLKHGIPKILKLMSPEPIHFFKTVGLSERNSLKIAAFVEVFFSVSLVIGFATRFAVIPLLVTMLIAAFYTLKSQSFDKKELPILFMLIYIVILFCGGGRFSLDYMIFGIN